MTPRVQARYRAVRAAMLEVLPAKGEGLTLEELAAAITPRLPRPLFPRGAGFYTLAVKTHLESIGLLTVVEGSRPARHLRCDDIDIV